MVERPIKKSERQSQVNTDSESQNLDSIPQQSNPKSLKKNNDSKSKSKGRKGTNANESVAPVNPALARPPKPVKPKVTVKTEPEETESQSITAESPDTTNDN